MIYSRDTSQEAERVQIGILRNMSVARRIAVIDGVNEMARQLALIGLRARHPGANAEELESRFFRLILGTALAEQVLGARRQRGIHAEAGMPDCLEAR